MLLALAACEGNPTPRPELTPSTAPYSSKPNIVFVLTDDLSTNLVRYMPHVLALQQTGMSFTNYVVTDSLCCPSRSSIFTGQFPHNTGVFTNDPPDGGMTVFRARGGEKRSFAPALQRAGYRTALMGKYLNGYAVGARVGGLPEDYVPPGWSRWAAGAGAYREFDYSLNQDHQIVEYGSDPQDYLTKVVAELGTGFIRSAVADRVPFMLELATYAPHAPYTPEPRDADSFLDLRAPRAPSFARIPTAAPKWMNELKPLNRRKVADIDRIFVKRVESVQSVDRAIGALETTLRRTGQLRNTVFVFSSDNGFHLGEHGLRAGKKTAFTTDVRVPLVIAGPGIKAGSVDDHLVQNIDLAPTFEELAGLTVPATVDGRSLVPLLHRSATEWRTIAAVEHHGPVTRPGDPDAQARDAGNPPSYTSLRGPDWAYTRYVDGSREYYDRRHDPDELVNIAGRLPAARIAELDRSVRAITGCHGAASCWAAGRPQRA